MLAVMGRKPKAYTHAGNPLHPILQWRERYAVQQQDLARACGISQATLSKIENWQQVPLGKKLETLIAYTGLSTDALVRPRCVLREDPDFLDKAHGPLSRFPLPAGEEP